MSIMAEQKKSVKNKIRRVSDPGLSCHELDTQHFQLCLLLRTLVIHHLIERHC